MKKLNGAKIKDKNNLNTNTLYSVSQSMTLQLEEVHKEDISKDIVYVEFQLEEKEYGVYGHEYRPLFLTEKSCKKLDLLGIVVSDKQKQITSYLFDVKKKVGGEDEIGDFIEQLEDGYLHKQAMMQYFSDYIEIEHIGVITRKFDEGGIKNLIDKKKEEINKMISIPMLLRSRIEIEKFKREMELKVLEDFLNKKVMIHGKRYDLEVHILQPKGNDYAINFLVKL